MDVDIRIDAGGWREVDGLEAAIRDAAGAAARLLADAARGEVSLLLTDDAAMRALNRDWRGRDAATNVLSFPAAATPAPGILAGDVALGWETVTREADAAGMPLLHHVAHLVVHGILHLYGHDHERDAEAEAMEALEREALAALGIPDPYAAPRAAQ